MPHSNRIFFLDNLRAVVIVLVVILHGSMTYMAYAPEWWYVVDPQTSLFFTMLVLLIDVPIMQIMFFVAGYFALPSLGRRGPRSFLKDKFVRVGAPWILGALLLAPPTSYLIYFSRRSPLSLAQFWATEFWSRAYQQSVYWFLGVLFFFFILLSLVYVSSSGPKSAARRVSTPSWALFAGFWALMTVAMLVINQFFPPETWYTNWYILVFQPLRVPLYIGYFVLGLYAYRRSWFSGEGYRPGLMPWALLWAAVGLLYLAYRIMVMPAFAGPPIVNQLLYTGLFNAFCLSSLMAGAAFFQTKVNGAGPFWKSLAASSYGIYYVHPLILYPLAYLFVAISLPLFLKAALVIGLAILLSWGVTTLILRKAPLLRQVF